MNQSRNKKLHHTFSRPTFPFTAIVGQPDLQQALLLVAIDQTIGGVLISGPCGTAKSTSARALAELLQEGQFVTLPLSSTDEQVTGTLDLKHALADHGVRFKPGLLARANHGVLYVDEVNLLSDGLVDILLDVSASGVNIVERDGISHVHESKFVLVGTMNPEEGELRPQLLDRFGLMIEIKNCFNPNIRKQIINARFAFDANPHLFCNEYSRAQNELSCRIREARARLSTIKFDDVIHRRVSDLCIEAAVDGLRADIVMLRAARALAAFDNQDIVSITHVDQIEEAVLTHRRTVRKEQKNLSQQRSGLSIQSLPKTPHLLEESILKSKPSSENLANQYELGYLPPESGGVTKTKSVVPILFESSKKKINF